MEPWMIWVGSGVICMIIEIFTPGFLFMSFGIGAILTGLISIFSERDSYSDFDICCDYVYSILVFKKIQ